MNNLLNIKSFLKFLGKNKAYTVIDVFGLSVSLMFVILISIYTVQELSVDKFQEHGDRSDRRSGGLPVAGTLPGDRKGLSGHQQQFQFDDRLGK